MNCLRCDTEIEPAGKINECPKCKFAWVVDKDEDWGGGYSANVTYYWTNDVETFRVPAGCLLVARDIEL